MHPLSPQNDVIVSLKDLADAPKFEIRNCLQCGGASFPSGTIEKPPAPQLHRPCDCGAFSLRGARNRHGQLMSLV